VSFRKSKAFSLLFILAFVLRSASSPQSFGATATATAELVAGFVVKLNLTDGGSGYTQAPPVTISGGGGFGARAVAEISGGKVTNLIVTSAGIGYTSRPQVIIGPAPGGFPLLRLEPTHVTLRVHAVLGHRYQIEASTDRITWHAVGLPFVPQNETSLVEARIDQLGTYLRASRID
jgi:hypothetical protein